MLSRRTSSQPKTARASCTWLRHTAKMTIRRRGSTTFRHIHPVNRSGEFGPEVTDFAGKFVKDADPMIIQDLKERGTPVQERDDHAQLSALLAVQDTAAVLCAGVVVHQHNEVCGPDDRAEQADQLGAAGSGGGAVRELAGGEQGLGALARPVLGNAASHLGVRDSARRRNASAALRNCARARTCPSRSICTSRLWMM